MVDLMFENTVRRARVRTPDRAATVTFYRVQITLL